MLVFCKEWNEIKKLRPSDNGSATYQNIFRNTNFPKSSILRGHEGVWSDPDIFTFMSSKSFFSFVK